MQYMTSNIVDPLTSAALLIRPVVVPSSDTAYSPSICFSLKKSRMDGMVWKVCLTLLTNQ